MADNTPAPRGQLTTRTLAMPADANPHGDIFGGWVLSQMDIAGGISAGQRAEGRVVTAAVEAMSHPASLRGRRAVRLYRVAAGRPNLPCDPRRGLGLARPPRSTASN